MDSKYPARMFRYYGLVLLSWVTVVLGVCFSGGGKVAVPTSSTIAFLILIVASVGAAALAIWTLAPEERGSRSWEPIVSLLLIGGISAIVVPVLYGARSASSPTVCLSNAKRLGLGLVIYISDFDERLPPIENWASCLKPYLKTDKFPRCPDASSSFSYGLNTAYSKIKVSDLKEPANSIIVFECDSIADNPHGGRSSFVPRHYDFGSAAFADGHAKRIRGDEKDVRWNP